jgi:hypothetical protein
MKQFTQVRIQCTELRTPGIQSKSECNLSKSKYSEYCQNLVYRIQNCASTSELNLPKPESSVPSHKIMNNEQNKYKSTNMTIEQ